MWRMNKIVDGWDTPGSANETSNSLLSYFGFKSTGGKGKKELKFPVKTPGRPCKAVYTGRLRNMSENEAISEAVVVFPCKDYGKEWSTNIVEAVPCEDDIIQAPQVPAAQSVNKHDAAHNYIYKIGPQYRQGMSVL